MNFELSPIMAISLCYIAGIALGRLWLEAPLWALLLPGLLLAAAGWALWKKRPSLFAAFILVAAAAGTAAFLCPSIPWYLWRPFRREGWKLFVRNADQCFSFTDCTSFALMQTHGLQNALAYDRHFTLLGFTLNLLPEL